MVQPSTSNRIDGNMVHETLGILVKNVGRINEKVKIQWNHNSYFCWVSEVMEDWAPDFLGGGINLSDIPGEEGEKNTAEVKDTVSGENDSNREPGRRLVVSGNRSVSQNSHEGNQKSPSLAQNEDSVFKSGSIPNVNVVSQSHAANSMEFNSTIMATRIPNNMLDEKNKEGGHWDTNADNSRPNPKKRPIYETERPLNTFNPYIPMDLNLPLPPFWCSLEPDARTEGTTTMRRKELGRKGKNHPRQAMSTKPVVAINDTFEASNSITNSRVLLV
ncbi:hypothetical protein L1987_48754 [Smallanthus sonchifolius]|uniref:Uncharacterized protein n=1 Tax=Smallanthus sonchifolius TaxID=185202 RepID=A0ACB9FSK5_9ASTR|nr:hypothetical protein L1987_48754 [Smallanthus sonchifolius]